MIFLSTLSLRRATGTVWRCVETLAFLSTLSLRRATNQRGPCRLFRRYFYPRSPCGERHSCRCRTGIIAVFLSTLSLRRATFCPTCQWRRSVISIHALLAESDDRRRRDRTQRNHFYPRSPCGERLRNSSALCMYSIFLSTLSLRRATLSDALACTVEEFLSTLSLRRATYVGRGLLIPCPNFYPRSPCGERRAFMFFRDKFIIFLSTLSLRRATSVHCVPISNWRISIHALLAESDEF